MKRYKDYLRTPGGLTLIFDQGNPISINVEDDRYHEVLTLIRNRDYDKIPECADRCERINLAGGKFQVKDGVVVIGGDSLPLTLSEKLLDFVDRKEDTKPLERFWANLKKNPSENSRKDLFDFMRANKMPITRDGHFIAYKKVRGDYLDCYTGKISNRPGRIIKMLRSEVDGDRTRTCSYGLHVAAFSYASTFSHGQLLEVKVNPADVVAVPPDYHQQKMRVCRYRVVRHATQEIQDLVYRHEPPRQFGDDSEVVA